MDRTALIALYRDGHAEVVRALDCAIDQELDRRPGEGCWTAREVVHHLADSETTSFIRLRKLVAEDHPTIEAYNENLYALRNHYQRPIETSLAVLAAVRSSSAELLDDLSDAEWTRTGTHSQTGSYSLDFWLTLYAEHAHDHADQIRRARRGER